MKKVMSFRLVFLAVASLVFLTAEKCSCDGLEGSQEDEFNNKTVFNIAAHPEYENSLINLVASKNGKYLYVINDTRTTVTAMDKDGNKNLIALTGGKVDVGDGADITNNSQFKQNNLAVENFSATFKGALFTVKDNSSVAGPIYVEGLGAEEKTPATDTDLAVNYPNGSWSKGGVKTSLAYGIKSGDDEYLYTLFSYSSNADVHLQTSNNPLPNTGEANAFLQRSEGVWSDFTRLTSDSDKHWFVVNEEGVRVFDSVIGRGVPNIAAPPKQNRADKWQFVAGEANTNVSSVLFNDNKLYVGLDSNGDENLGGVMVYDASSITDQGAFSAPPQKKLKGKTMVALLLHDDVVYAISSTDIDGFNQDGSAVDEDKSYKANLPAGFNITSAAFFKDNLIVSGADGSGNKTFIVEKSYTRVQVN